MKILLISFLLLAGLCGFTQNMSLHDFSAHTINGEHYDFAVLKGKKVLIVNTASECMLTPQYKKLQELYEEYGGDDFEIIAFPCNDFGKQEPGTNQEIKTFCQHYEVSFPIMEKITIKGDSIHPVYQWLTNSEKNGTLDAKVRWNFQKFMIDPDGQVVDFAGPAVSPLSNKIIEWLQGE
jgi:glutathione peroxidase